MVNMTDDQRRRIYLPAIPNLPSKDVVLQRRVFAARIDLIERLQEKGFVVEHSLGQETWVKNLGARTDEVDGMLFPPMSGLLEGEDAIKIKAQRFFEFISLVTSMHVGDHRIYGSTGISKPCGLIDIDGSWQSTLDLLQDFHHKGAFSTKVEDIVFCVQAEHKNTDPGFMNKGVVDVLHSKFLKNAGKQKKEVHTVFAADHIFTSFRKDFARSDFGVIAFGSATMKNDIYIKEAFEFCRAIGQRGLRLITGGGKESLMGAFDAGFHEGAVEFNKQNPDAPTQPAHIGISTNDVLRLEGPPEHLDQLIVLSTRNDRLRAFINGRGHGNKEERASRTAKIACIFPGGVGTLEEFATMMQLKLHGKMMDGIEIHICNINGYFDQLIKICNTLGAGHLFRVFPDQKSMLKEADEIYNKWLKFQP